MFTLTYGTFSLLLGTLTLQGEGGQETAIFLVTCSAIFLIKQKRGGGQKVWKYVYVIYEWLLRKETVADFLANLFKKNSNRGDFINLAQKQLIGQSVMTSYRYLLELIKVKEQFLVLFVITVFPWKVPPLCSCYLIDLTVSSFEYLLLFSSVRRTWKNQNKHSIF